jgi:hypothetical protein
LLKCPEKFRKAFSKKLLRASHSGALIVLLDKMPGWSIGMRIAISKLDTKTRSGIGFADSKSHTNCKIKRAHISAPKAFYI